MRRVLITCGVSLAFALGGCSKTPEAQAPEHFPKPIEVVEDAATAAPQPPAGQATARPSPEFECVAGAAPEQGLVEAEPPSTRDDGGGHIVSVSSYVGDHLTVFGLQAQYVQRLSEPGGWSGVGAYVKADEATVSGLIQARFPNTRTENGYLRGDGMANPIVLQGTTGDLLYIQCAPAR